MAGAAGALERGRESYAKRSWADAHESLTRADRVTPLAAEDLELLATAAFMLGRDDDLVAALERAHHAHLAAGAPLRAARSAFWAGMNLVVRGKLGPGTGWIGRAQRLIEHEEDCAERGYLLLPVMFRHEAAGDFAAAAAMAADAAAIGQRFGETDLFALAIHAQGQMLIREGRIADGLALLDEAMLAVTRSELSPIVNGLVYCGVILACQQVYEFRRAQEWTAALARWCDEQEDLVAFTGRCLTHRAEIMQVQGAWGEALEEARAASQRLLAVENRAAAGLALYREGELHRLRGNLGEAERAYREASRCGWEPQPGLALLLLAQGQRDAAAAAVRRTLAETTERVRRAGLLPACVEIMLATGEHGEAREACRELEEIGTGFESAMLDAIVAQCRGAVDLADGEAEAALVALRRAWHSWQDLEAPYDAARTRVLLAQACRTLGDEDAAARELDAARETFAGLGATRDVALVDSLRRPPARETHGLTGRELEVLRLVAAGMSNREIAAALVLSEHTVARHLQNIFTKLRLSSRTAATAFAFEHDLV